METYKIELEPYCEDCPEFDADVEETQERYASGPPSLYLRIGPVTAKYYRTITCSHMCRCKSMIEHLKEKEKEE